MDVNFDEYCKDEDGVQSFDVGRLNRNIAKSIKDGNHAAFMHAYGEWSLEQTRKYVEKQTKGLRSK